VPFPSTTNRTRNRGYAGLDFIKAAFCPLSFKAVPLKDHPLFADLRADHALGVLEVGDALHYPRQFRYKDRSANYKLATQLITAPFGLAPKDFDLLLGLYAHLKDLDHFPDSGELDLTADFIGRRCGFSVTSQKDYLRIRSRIFRFSYVKYTNSAFWNPQTQTYDIRNFEFYSLASLSRVTVSRRPITFHFSRDFLEIAERSKFLVFDYHLYLSLPCPMRRFYLLANQMGWNNRDSVIFDVDEFAIHQIGYQADSDPKKGAEGRKLRRQKIRRLLKEAESRDLIRRCPGWSDYFAVARCGPLRGRLVLRWSRGPKLLARGRSKPRSLAHTIENDALYDQIKALRDEQGESVTPIVFHAWVEKYGRELLQKHLRVILAQKEHEGGSFKKREGAARVDRGKHDYAEPDWYADLHRQERLSPFRETTPNQRSMEVYENFFR